MVAEILGVIDNVRGEDPQDEDRRTPTTIQPPPDLPPSQQTPISPQAAAQPLSPLLRGRQEHQDSLPRLPVLEDRRSWLPAAALGFLLLGGIGAGAAYLVTRNGSEATTQAQTGGMIEDSAALADGGPVGEQSTAGGQATEEAGATEGSSDQAPTVADEPIIVAPADGTKDADPADMMSIRVEPEGAEVIDPVTNQPIQIATATVRADGLLHLDGAFPSEAEAERYVAGMAEVFGLENIVRNYEINPAAPSPRSSDVSLDKPVLFSSGTAEIDPSYIPYLEACGDVMKLNPHITMSIAAFTDSAGSEEFNLELSKQRAQAIYDFYLSYDLDRSQLESLAYGEAEPVADNTTAEGRQQNRRAMLTLLDVLATNPPGADSE